MIREIRKTYPTPASQIRRQCAHAMLFIAAWLFGLLLPVGGITVTDNTEDNITQTLEQLRRQQTGIQQGRAAFESVFDLPDTLKLTVSLQNTPPGRLGQYIPDKAEIQIAHSEGTPALTTLHELGHWADSRVLAPILLKDSGVTVNEFTFAAKTLCPNMKPTPLVGAKIMINPLRDWCNAVTKSQTWRDMETARREAVKDSDFPALLHLDYVMGPDEMWARSLAQYVALKSGDDSIQGEAGALVKTVYPYNGGWTDKDFEPIYVALDKLFTTQKLLKTTPTSAVGAK